MTHSEAVQQIYEAFGRGDVPAVLEHLADDVEWEYGPASADVPWLKPRRGRTAVAGFFESLDALEMTKFQVKHVLEQGNVVVSLLDVEATVSATGRSFAEEDEVHIWYFNDEGKVQRFRHQVDSYQHWAAAHAVERRKAPRAGDSVWAQT